jgi:hypothetical protein
MSIRLSLYDFFSYTIPGIFYLLIIGYWLNAFGVVAIDLSAIGGISLSALLILIGAGYIVGMLIDPIAYRWTRLFYSRNRAAAKKAFEEFHNQHPWAMSYFEPSDWAILLRVIKSVSREDSDDVEQHNVAFIMLRNISFGLLIMAACCVVFFIAVSRNPWNLVLAVVFAGFAVNANRQSSIRRGWFYLGIFEWFAAQKLLKKDLISEGLLEKVGKADEAAGEGEES